MGEYEINGESEGRKIWYQGHLGLLVNLLQWKIPGFCEGIPNANPSNEKYKI